MCKGRRGSCRRCFCVSRSNSMRNFEVLIDLIPTAGAYKTTELNCQQKPGPHQGSCWLSSGNHPGPAWPSPRGWMKAWYPIITAGRGIALVGQDLRSPRLPSTLLSGAKAICVPQRCASGGSFGRNPCVLLQMPLQTPLHAPWAPCACVREYGCLPLFFLHQHFFTNYNNSQIFLCLCLVAAVKTNFHLAYDFNTSACNMITLTGEQYRPGRTQPESSFFNCAGNAWAQSTALISY